MSRSIHRSVALFAFLCLIGVSLASAAPIRGENRSAAEGGGIARVFRALPELWTSVTGFFMKTGSSLDPSGSFMKEGSSLDPHGSPPSSASTDTGSSLDPHG